MEYIRLSLFSNFIGAKSILILQVLLGFQWQRFVINTRLSIVRCCLLGFINGKKSCERSTMYVARFFCRDRQARRRVSRRSTRREVPPRDSRNIRLPCRGHRKSDSHRLRHRYGRCDWATSDTEKVRRLPHGWVKLELNCILFKSHCVM